jgi:hypothetical protein
MHILQPSAASALAIADAGSSAGDDRDATFQV